MQDLATIVAEMRRLGVSEASFADGRPTRVVLGRAPHEDEAHAAEDEGTIRARREATLYGASR